MFASVADIIMSIPSDQDVRYAMSKTVPYELPLYTAQEGKSKSMSSIFLVKA